jgi:drug/metabolite transporter (DMT)-like permease
VSAGVALALFASALWGLTPVATRGALAGYSPELIAAIRLGLGALFFRALAGAGTPWWPRERWSLVAGLALGADFVLYNYGLGSTTAALASLVVNVEVVTTIALALWLLGERLTARRVLGAALTLAGVLWVATEGVALADVVARERLLGNLLVMLAGSAWSLYAVAQRRAPRSPSLARLMAPIFAVAWVASLPGLLRAGAWHNPGGAFATAMLAVLVALCTIAVYVVYARSQDLVDVSVLAIVLTSIPVFAVAFAWLLLGESVSARALAGGVVIVAGVLLIATERHPLPTSRPS